MGRKKNSQLHFKIILACLSVFLCLSAARIAWASTLSLESQATQITPGRQFVVTLYVDTGQQEINAIGATLAYPANLLKLESIDDSNSVINFWADQAVVPTACQSRCEVKFGGIVPGGLFGQKDIVLSFVFRAVAPGSGAVAILDPQILLNDGKGTAAAVAVRELTVVVSSDAAAGFAVLPDLEKTDIDLPETFTPQLARSPSLFDNGWFLAFAAQDKGSGIDHYEVAESPAAASPAIYGSLHWSIQASPYLIKDQSLKSYIYVKAVDKAGQERVEMVEPPPANTKEPGLGKIQNWVIIGLMVLLLASLVQILSRQGREGKKSNDNSKISN